MPLLSDPTPVVAQPASEEVFRTLRRMILAGQLRHGEHLVERRLAEQLRVSRTPIREALRKLEAEGLVRREPYRGLVVASLTPEEVNEISLIREVLEGLAARQAALHRTQANLRTLRSLLRQMENASRDKTDGAPGDFADLHARFHDTLVLAAASPRLRSFLSTLRDYLESFASLGYRQSGRGRQAFAEHQEIVQHIAAGKADQAEEVARLHIRHSKDALLAVLQHELGAGPTP